MIGETIRNLQKSNQTIGHLLGNLKRIVKKLQNHLSFVIVAKEFSRLPNTIYM